MELHNLEAESDLVGSILIANNLIDGVADIVGGDDFHEPILGAMFTHCCEEYAAGRVSNPVTLIPHFKEWLKEGGLDTSFLMQLTNTAAYNLLSAIDLARRIADLSKRRRMQDGLKKAADLCSDGQAKYADIVAEADDAVSDEASGTLHQPTGAECLDELIAGFKEDRQGVICRSIPSLDSVLGPIRPKQLVIGAARPGMGKTAVWLSYGLGAAQNGSGVLFVSLEMSSHELAQRMASDICYYQKPVPFNAIRDGKLKTDQLKQVYNARETLSDIPFQVVDAGNLTTGRLSSLIRRHARKMEGQGHKLELVIVDYLQLLSPDVRGRSNYESVSEVSKALKLMAKENNVGIVALAQLSREVEKRPDKRPQLSDLRDSGQIEQDADVVLFLLRNEYYLMQEELDQMDAKRPGWEAAMEAVRNEIEFIVAKRRNGSTGSSKGQFFGQFQAVR